jgi:DNA repair exonuclease SbcCD ATPase subunit
MMLKMMERLLASQEVKDARLKDAKAKLEESKAGLEEMEAAVDAFEESLDKMEATDLETNPEATEASGLRKKLVAVLIQKMRSAVPALCKGHIRKRSGKFCDARKASKRMVVKRRRKGLECINGIRNRDLKEQLHLGSKGASNKMIRPLGLEAEK